MHSCMLHKTILLSPSAFLSGLDHFYNKFEVSFDLQKSCKDFLVRIMKDNACRELEQDQATCFVKSTDLDRVEVKQKLIKGVAN